jgi:hypothetical protein
LILAGERFDRLREAGGVVKLKRRALTVSVEDGAASQSQRLQPRTEMACPVGVATGIAQ